MNIDPQKVIELIVRAAGEYDDVREAATGYASLAAWKRSQLVQVGTTGAIGGGVPGYHLVTVPLELAVLVRKIGRASWGIGCLHARDTGQDLVDPADDLFAILAAWGKDMTRKDYHGIAASAAGLGFLVAGQSYPSFAAAAIANAFGMAAGKAAAVVLGSVAGDIVTKNLKLGSMPALQKITEKFMVKLVGKSAGKMLGGFVPLVGAVVGGGINVYLLTKVMAAAEIYYSEKSAALRTRV